MKLISWNIRGLNSPGKHKMIKNMLQREKPNILFLQETKCNSDVLGSILSKAWPSCSSVAVDASGSSGGLAIAWDTQSMVLSNFHAAHNLIQATFHPIGSNIHGHLSNVYFPQEHTRKIELLNTMEALNSHRTYPLWIAAGDFNMITKMDERTGGRPRSDPESAHFKDFITNSWLIDIPFSNDTFTWNNKRTGAQHIASKLDRFLISDNAIHLGGDLSASILPLAGSDHWPIALHWQNIGPQFKKPFKFEAFWLSHPSFKEMVTTAWHNFTPPKGSRMYQFQQKLKYLKALIKNWNSTVFGNIFKEIKVLKSKMEETQQKIIVEGRTDELSSQEQELQKQLEERCRQEEILWRQKSRITWLKEGERNTKFFHRSTIQRRMQNRIHHITNQQGEQVEQHEEIEQVLPDYFKSIQQEDRTIDRQPAIDTISQLIPKLVTAEHNKMLLRPVSLQEVETAMGQTKDGKALGPDGFTSNFFHHFWQLIKTEVWDLVEESRAAHWLLPSLNATFIALVPKEEQPSTPEKYRPIALCNVIYKVISKVIANRLKPLLLLLISPEQTGYVEGRQIMDGIILTHEVIHSLKSTKKPDMLLKIDLSKAFDKLCWRYIQSILRAFGFDQMWIRWIMSLISMPLYSILVNGIPSTPFVPSRGIRQGDPLSPFIFVLMTEGLSRLIQHAVLSGQLRGISLHGSPTTTHQQFVDDNMLFGFPSAQEARSFKNILNLFFVASGMTVNVSKSQLFFFNTPPIIQTSIARILGFSLAHLPAKYLGAPLIDSALKHSAWNHLLEKLEARLSSWTFRALNLASRLVLIKAVLKSCPFIFSLCL